MTNTTKIQISSKGTVTIPVGLRRKYGIVEGDFITLIELGDGSFLLTPVIAQVDRFGDRVVKALAEADVSEDELLAALDEGRECYHQERYVRS